MTQKQSKLFAFKLAEKKVSEAKPATQWQVREGVAIAGCTVVDKFGNYAESYFQWPTGVYIADKGYYC